MADSETGGRTVVEEEPVESVGGAGAGRTKVGGDAVDLGRF